MFQLKPYKLAKPIVKQICAIKNEERPCRKYFIFIKNTSPTNEKTKAAMVIAEYELECFVNIIIAIKIIKPVVRGLKTENILIFSRCLKTIARIAETRTAKLNNSIFICLKT